MFFFSRVTPEGELVIWDGSYMDKFDLKPALDEFLSSRSPQWRYNISIPH